MYRIFRLCFLGYEALKGVTIRKSDMGEIDELSKYFSELYILTYTDLHPPCDTVQSCSQQEDKFVENKNGAMEILLKEIILIAVSRIFYSLLSDSFYVRYEII